MSFHSPSSANLKNLGNVDILLDSNEKTNLNPILPLVVFVYAIKNILYPTFLIKLIPDFLDILTMVEFYRIRATEEASTALAWDDFYKADESTRALEVKDKDYLNHLQDTQKEMRQIFMQIVAECCFLVSIPIMSPRFVSYFISRIYTGCGSLKVIPISGFGGIDILTPKKTPSNSLAFITAFRMPTRIFCVFQRHAVLTQCTRPSFVLRTVDLRGK